MFGITDGRTIIECDGSGGRRNLARRPVFGRRPQAIALCIRPGRCRVRCGNDSRYTVNDNPTDLLIRRRENINCLALLELIVVERDLDLLVSLKINRLGDVGLERNHLVASGGSNRRAKRRVANAIDACNCIACYRPGRIRLANFLRVNERRSDGHAALVRIRDDERAASEREADCRGRSRRERQLANTGFCDDRRSIIGRIIQGRCDGRIGRVRYRAIRADIDSNSRHIGTIAANNLAVRRTFPVRTESAAIEVQRVGSHGSNAADIEQSAIQVEYRICGSFDPLGIPTVIAWLSYLHLTAIDVQCAADEVLIFGSPELDSVDVHRTSEDMLAVGAYLACAG